MLALEIFNVIEEKAYRPQINIYLEQFDREWHPVSNNFLSTNNTIPCYTTNSILHLIESYTLLYTVTGKEEVQECLHRLLKLFYNKIYDSENRRCRIAFDENWKSLDNSISYGHDIEASWLIDRAMAVINFYPDHYVKMTDDLCNNTLLNAYSEGMIISDENNGIINNALVWWVQAEAVIGFYNQFEKTGNVAFLSAGRKTLSVTLTKMVDERDGGEWYWSVDRLGNPLEDFGISENWKANYHNVRMCLEVLKRRKLD